MLTDEHFGGEGGSHQCQNGLFYFIKSGAGGKSWASKAPFRKIDNFFSEKMAKMLNLCQPEPRKLERWEWLHYKIIFLNITIVSNSGVVSHDQSYNNQCVYNHSFSCKGFYREGRPLSISHWRLLFRRWNIENQQDAPPPRTHVIADCQWRARTHLMVRR